MQQPENQSSLFSELEYDPMAKSYISSMASWALIVGVCAVISLCLSIYELYRPREVFSRRTEGFGSLEMVSNAATGSGIISIIITLVINIILIRFAVSARRQLENGNAIGLGQSFGNLKAYFMIISILVILGMTLIFLALLVAGTF
ncbi:MAG: hypothetical protein QM781_16180 [Chitinophagaceae bacterium]